MSFLWPKSTHRPKKAALSLQNKLLITFLPVGLLPIIIAGGISGFLTYRSTTQQAELRLNNLATVTAEFMAKDLGSKMTLLATLTANPLVLDQARAAARQAEVDHLDTLSIDTLESRFAETKLLNLQPKINDYLQNVALQSGFAEIFFTDRHGFNVAYSRPTSDFVQRDEAWWQISKQHQQWIGNPKFDPSSQTVTIEVVTTMVEPDSQNFLGILKGGYDVANLNDVKNKLQNLDLEGSEQVQILTTGNPITAIATITSQESNSSQEIIGKDAIAKQVVRLQKASQDQGFTFTDSDKYTISWNDSDRLYTLATISGTNWVAVSSVTTAQVQSSARQIGSLFSLFFLGLGGLTTWVILRFSHRLSAPLNSLALVAQQATERSDFTMRTTVSTEGDEVSLLATSFNQLLQRVQQLLQEQTEAKAQLEMVNQTLEQKVQKRTQELEEYNQTLAQKVQERTQELEEKTICLEKTLHQLQQTQSQMIQAEKMSSLGQLVAGIAHEINNPVNFIHGNLFHIDKYAQDLLALLRLYQLELSYPSRQIANKIAEIDLDFLSQDLPNLLHSMEVGTSRIREIVTSLRTFSRIDEAEIKAVDIHEGIDSTLMILDHRLKSSVNYNAIEIIKEYGELPLVECQGGSINQVFLNILTNAIDALEESRNLQEYQTFTGCITIQTAVIDSEWVQIAIADNGPGIPQVIQKRIFDPFFTTKAVGKGTGMGMSISYQIITEKHHGKLECFSKFGQGAKFVIQIPIRQIADPSFDKPDRFTPLQTQFKESN